jgi:tetratricopeptide (TPR) repeat protein
MFKKTFFFSIAFSFCLAAIAQKPITFEQLIFKDDFEKNIFQNYQKLSENEASLKLLAAASPGDSEKNWIKSQEFFKKLISELDKEEIADKKLKKSTKIIFETLHKHLTKYVEITDFSEIYTTGIYNCLSATAAYSFIFDQYKVPYSILEYSNHVNVLVSPGLENIVIETTAPVDGVYPLDVKKTVEYLRKNKLISEDDYKSQTPDEIYETYYGKNEKRINLLKIAALQYSNISAKLMESQKYDEALVSIEKSLFIYPDSNRMEVRKGLRLTKLEKLDFEKAKDYQVVFDLMEYPDIKEKFLKVIPEDFEKFAAQYLYHEYDKEKYDEAYQIFSRNLKEEPKQLEEIRNLHFFYQGTNLAMKDKLIQSLVYLDSAYQIRPKDVKLQAVISDVIGLKLKRDIDKTVRNDEFGWYYEYEKTFLKYPFLMEMDKHHTAIWKFRKLKVETIIDESESDSEITAAVEEYEQKLESLRETDVEMYYDLIGQAYHSLFGSFIRNKDFEKARAIAKKGLEKSPNNPHLVKLEGILNDHIKKYGRN